jgi:(1->4)-alpha-D-glucan 1-alpha-D-glucosylmutase
VDFEERRQVLAEIVQKSKLPRRQLVDWLQVTWESGAIKLWLTRELLKLRRHYEAVFEQGDYTPLQTKGPRQTELFAFARHHHGQWVLVIVPTAHHLSELVDNYALLPKEAPSTLWNYLEQKKVDSQGRWLDLNEQSTGLPLILTSEIP